MIKQVDSKIMEKLNLWEVRGLMDEDYCDSYDDEAYGYHILSDFVKVKLTRVLFKEICTLKYISVP